MTKIHKSNSRGNREIPVTVVHEFSVGADELRHQRIAEKAHEIYESRGCCHGRDLDDWLEAERVVLGEMAATRVAGDKTSRPRAKRAIKR